MRTGSIILAASLALSAAVPALAQDGAAAIQAAGARLEAEQAQARASAARSGDELLTCEQIEAEMGVSVNTEEMLTQRAEIGASVERQQERMNAQAGQQQAAAAESQREMAGIIGNFTEMMPAMMRGQRLSELAQARDCAFAQGMPQTER